MNELRIAPWLGVVCILATVSLIQAERPKPQIYATIDGDPMYSVLPPDTIRAIKEPAFVRGKQAKAQMADNEPILAVSLGGEHRAYSLWHLDTHEIVNDEAGGKKFAVTW